MRILLIGINALALVFFVVSPAATQHLVRLDKNNLVYSTYANTGQTNPVNIIPDFSSCGYGKGGVSLPFVQTVTTIRPQRGDCRQLIQDAIDELSQKPADAKGFRGAILLKKGIYHVNGLLTINAGGVVIRGEGTGPDGTVLLAQQKTQSDFITIKGSAQANDRKTALKITTPYVATGAMVLEVQQGHSLKPGDAIVIEKTPNKKWIDDLGMAQYGWTDEQYKISYERTVSAVENNTITIDIPVVDPIEEQYGGAVVYKYSVKGRIAQCGIENLRIESVFETNEDEKHGWNAIVLNHVEHSWVKNVVVKYFGYSCVNIESESAFNTVQDCAMIDPKSVTTGGRKYSFNIAHGSTGNLFQRCVTWGGRHDYVTGARVPGPNVFLDCVAENTFADVGPHHRWATGLLFDNIYCGELRVQNRKAMGTGHGWAGVQTLFWNSHSSAKEIKVESPTGAMNWGIGCTGLKQNGAGYWEKWGEHVTPRSLYLKQLEQRLGARAVKNITTPEQRAEGVWQSLKNWSASLVEENKIVAP